MEQVKRYTGRAAALVLACFVVAFSVSVPAFAATGDLVSLSGSAVFRAASQQMGGNKVSFNFPYSNSTGITSTMTNDTLTNIAGNFIDIYNIKPGNYRVSYRIAFAYQDFPMGSVVYKYSPNFALYENSTLIGTYNAQNVQRDMAFNSVKDVFVLTETFDFTVPSNVYSTVIRLTTSSFQYSGYVSGEMSIACTLYDFDFYKLEPNALSGSLEAIQGSLNGMQGSLNEITKPSAGDQSASNQLQGNVNDKNQQTNDVNNQLEQLQKPTVGTNSSGAPVVGGMVVDPMQQIDPSTFSKLTGVIGTIFGSSTILSYFIIAFSFIFISYVIFGKSG